MVTTTIVHHNSVSNVLIMQLPSQKNCTVACTTTEQPRQCSVYLINDGYTVNGSSITVEFRGTSEVVQCRCFLDNQETTPGICVNSYHSTVLLLHNFYNTIHAGIGPVTFHNLSEARHLFKITPHGCQRNRSPLQFTFDVGEPTVNYCDVMTLRLCH